MDRLVLRLNGGYYFHTLNRLIADLQPVFAVGGRTQVTVDLTNLTFMGPAALALTLGILSWVSSRGWLEAGSRVLPPASEGAKRYLHRVNFFRELLEQPEFPDPAERRKAVGFRECRRFSDEADRLAVTTSLVEVLRETLRADDHAETSLRFCLDELTENVIYHAAAPFGGIAASQSLRHSKEVELAIVDFGVGIKESLSRNPTHREEAKDDLSAIRAALRPLVTATPERNSGYGLAFTESLVDTNGGRLLIRSGFGQVQRGDRVIERLNAHPLPGTLVGLRLHTDRPFDYHLAYKMLEQAAVELGQALDDH